MSPSPPASFSAAAVSILLSLYCLAFPPPSPAEPLIVEDPDKDGGLLSIELLPGGGFKCMESRETLADGAVLELKSEDAGAERVQKVVLTMAGRGTLEAPVCSAEMATSLHLTPDKMMAVMTLTYTEGWGGWFSCFLVARKTGENWRFQRVKGGESFEKARRHEEWFEGGPPLDNRPVIHCVRAFFPPGSDLVSREEGELDLANSTFTPFGDPAKQKVITPGGMDWTKPFHVHLDPSKNVLTLSVKEPEVAGTGMVMEAEKTDGKIVYLILVKGLFIQREELITRHLRAAFPGLTPEAGVPGAR